MKRGSLIAFEGLDGSGKSTQVTQLAGAFFAAGREVVTTREPTDGPFGRRIRSMAASGEPVLPDEELRWFVEDRRAHVKEVIAPPGLERAPAARLMTLAIRSKEITIQPNW